MEKTEQKKTRAPKPIQTLLTASLLSILTTMLPLGLIVVPAYLAFAAFSGGIAALATGAGIFAAASFAFYGPSAAVSLTVLFAGAAVCIYLMMKARMPHAHVVLAAAGIAMVGFYGLVCMPGILSGDGAFAAVQAVVDDSIALMQDMTKTAQAMGAVLDPNALKVLDSYYATLSADTPKLVVPLLAVFASVTGLANVLFFRLFVRRRAEEFHLLPLHAFRDWRVPSGLTVGLFLMLIGALILNFAGWDYAEGLSNTVEILAVMPFMLQGVCVTDFLIMRRSKNPAAMRTIIYILMVILFGAFRTPLLIVGAMDQLFHLRDRANGVLPFPPNRE